MLFQTSLGIDIQDNSISLAYLKASFKGVRLAVHAAYPVEAKIPLKEKVDLIGGMVKDFLKKNGISPAFLFLGIPRETAILRYVELPLAVKENLGESLGYEMEKYIPFPADEIYFDYQITAEDKASGKLKLLLVAARKGTVDLYLNLAAHIGVGTSGIEISSTAVANYFSSQKGSGGTGTCAVVCLRDDRLELDGLKEGFLDSSRSVDRKEWGDDLSGFISRELERQKEGLEDHEGRLPTLFCGFDAESECIDYFKADERINVRLVDLAKSGLSSSAMIPAYGLALKGIWKQQSDINLVPKERRKRPNKAGYYAMISLTGLLVVLALAWGGGSIISQQLHLRRLNAEIARMGIEVASIEQAKAEYKKKEDRIEYLSSLYGARIPILDVLKELSVRIPKTAWVKRLTFSDHEVITNGFAESSSELIPSLENSPLFRDVAFRSSITRVGGEGNKEFFRIGLKVVE